MGFYTTMSRFGAACCCCGGGGGSGGDGGRYSAPPPSYRAVSYHTAGDSESSIDEFEEYFSGTGDFKALAAAAAAADEDCDDVVFCVVPRAAVLCIGAHCIQCGSGEVVSAAAASTVSMTELLPPQWLSVATTAPLTMLTTCDHHATVAMAVAEGGNTLHAGCMAAWLAANDITDPGCGLCASRWHGWRAAIRINRPWFLRLEVRRISDQRDGTPVSDFEPLRPSCNYAVYIETRATSICFDEASVANPRVDVRLYDVSLERVLAPADHATLTNTSWAVYFVDSGLLGLRMPWHMVQEMCDHLTLISSERE